MPHYSATLTSPAAFPAVTAPNLALDFVPDTWVFWNTGAKAIEVSFDGVQVHAKLPVTAVVESPLARIEVRSKCKKLWIQDGAGGGGTLNVMAHTDK